MAVMYRRGHALRRVESAVLAVDFAADQAFEQRVRFASAMEEKQRRYGERYPLDEDFLDAVAVMPQASGVALGSRTRHRCNAHGMPAPRRRINARTHDRGAHVAPRRTAP